MIQKFLLRVSHLYNCHYQLGVNIATIHIDSPIDGVLRGIKVCTQVLTYVPPLFF